MKSTAIPSYIEDAGRKTSLVETTPTACKPGYGLQAAERHRTVIAFTRARSAARSDRISARTKVTVFFVVALLISAAIYMGWLGWAAYKTIQQGQQQDRQQNQRLAQLEEQVARNNSQLGGLAESDYQILAGLSLPAELWRDYNKGVCLISGSYVFIDKDTGQPVRAPKTPKDESASPASGKAERLPSTREREGPIAEVVFEGTGFHVGGGYILTNRHIVEPWKYSFWPQLFSSLRNAQPRLAALQAFFPGQSQPYSLQVRQVAANDDLAVCELDVAKDWKDIPALPLDHSTASAKVGYAVTMMGYPDGVDRLLAVLPKEESQRLLKHYGEAKPLLIEQLAQRSLVKPLTAQGHVMDLYDNRIVYDAASGEGSSGAPLFGPSGRVIGINYGYFLQNKTSNYAVPVGRGLSLLQHAGWKSED